MGSVDYSLFTNELAENDVIEHIKLLPSCVGVVLYVADRIVEQEIETYTETSTIILTVQPEKTSSYLNKLSFLVEESYADCFRIILNCSQALPVLLALNKG